MKTCVAYFSKNGNTRIVSEYVANKAGATLIELKENKNYKGFVGFIKGGFRASTHKIAKLDSSIYDEIVKHDTIILATPVWAGQTTPAINAAIKNIDFTSKKVFVITTQADPACGGHNERFDYYKKQIEERSGTFIDCFFYCGRITR